MKKHLIFLVAAVCLAGITMQAQQRLVLFEQFTSSTCGPCYSMNLWLNPLLVSNANKVVVVRYQMNWPGSGDPYYTAEGGTRRSYYGVNTVPYPLTNGVYTGSSSTIQNAINTGYAQPAQATITGAFSVSGTTISISGSVTPLISGSGHKIYVIVNEKRTTDNKRTNGETEFFHVMMKMFPNGGGQEVTLTAGTPIPFNYTYDMSTTHVEEMDDLEVVVFVQNVSTKAILNAAYLDDDNNPTPENVTATQESIDNLNVNITWGTPSGITPEGFNVYRNNVKLNTSLITGNSYQDEAPEYAKTYTYAVSMVAGGSEGFKKQDTVLIRVTMPEAAITSIKHIRGKKMQIEWEVDTEYPVKYYIYRNSIIQNSGNPISETVIEHTAPDYNKEYCFQIEPVFNEITGVKSTKECITLIKVGMPTNMKAKQIAVSEKDVRLTWDATSNAVSYNIYRDNVRLNTEAITTLEYIDVAPEFGVEYIYQVYGVATTGGEGETGGTAKITLVDNDIPVPTNVQATQQEGGMNVSVTWDAVTEINTVTGYNVYRDGVKINTALVTEIEYLDTTIPEAGNYCYRVSTVAEGEESGRSEEACVDVTPVGICNIDKDALFAIYPNPVSETLNISTKETITDCQIYNIQGQLIYSTKMDVKEIATDGWTSGIYIIRITTEKGAAEKRFVKN